MTTEAAPRERQTEEQAVPIKRNLHQITLGLPHDTMEALRVLAKKRGVAPGTLLRLWTVERVRQETEEERRMQEEGNR